MMSGFQGPKEKATWQAQKKMDFEILNFFAQLLAKKKPLLIVGFASFFIYISRCNANDLNTFYQQNEFSEKEKCIIVKL